MDTAIGVEHMKEWTEAHVTKASTAFVNASEYLWTKFFDAADQDGLLRICGLREKLGPLAHSHLTAAKEDALPRLREAFSVYGTVHSTSFALRQFSVTPERGPESDYPVSYSVVHRDSIMHPRRCYDVHTIMSAAWLTNLPHYEVIVRVLRTR